MKWENACIVGEKLKNVVIFAQFVIKNGNVVSWKALAYMQVLGEKMSEPTNLLGKSSPKTVDGKTNDDTRSVEGILTPMKPTTVIPTIYSLIEGLEAKNEKLKYKMDTLEDHNDLAWKIWNHVYNVNKAKIEVLKQVAGMAEAEKEKLINQSCHTRAGSSRVPFEIAINSLEEILGTRAEGE